MKKLILYLLMLGPVLGFCQPREWYTSLEAAKGLALVQNKMVLMMWEESASFPFPVVINTSEGKSIYIDDLFQNEFVSNLIWEYFIPVKVSESFYADMIEPVEAHQNQRYIDKFNDDSMKVLDANGNILNVYDTNDYYNFNMSKFIQKYGLNTSFLKGELLNYSKVNDYYSSYRLADKYIEFASYISEDLRKEIIELSTIYLEEAQRRLDEVSAENKPSYLLQLELLELKQSLILNKPRRVLRLLKKMDTDQGKDFNQSLIDFLNYTAYGLLKDEDNASVWRSKLSLVNLKKANQIINSNL
ncbi:hypothetical protein [Psychroserpens sp. SPM9]|uniref:hypothetical protein n=1 Tax=Psychroserpens sp. SPM9 TaxID=2975598 RepID=UPI0021A865E7|nr:hypothetical protein [Psychroserpens sp. SPM9]MDG5492637.1 hypothetical protein [Psychroserpens sp. SPM9]